MKAQNLTDLQVFLFSPYVNRLAFYSVLNTRRY